ncbi:hypothetical protein GCM10023223_03530 [Stackebrandtia albiflava]
MALMAVVIGDPAALDASACPSCGYRRLDVLFVGDGATRIGWATLWCGDCLRGIRFSRVCAPRDLPFLTFEVAAVRSLPEIIEVR